MPFKFFFSKRWWHRYFLCSQKYNSLSQDRMFIRLVCCTWSLKILISSLSWSITVWESLSASKPPPSLSFFSRRHMWSSRNLTIIRLEWMNLSFWVRASSSWATFWSSIWVKSGMNVTPMHQCCSLTASLAIQTFLLPSCLHPASSKDGRLP